MRVLACHNYYQLRGGEDLSFHDEISMLRNHGHAVETLTVHNDQVNDQGKIALAIDTFWSRNSYRRVEKKISDFKPDVIHCTNIFPLLSPSVYFAAQKKGVAVVQSLRNYRLICPGATLLRQGSICEKCINKRIAYPAIVHKCYRGDLAASTILTLHNAVHRSVRTWQKKVSAFFAISEFTRKKYIEAGFDPQRMFVKPNFLSGEIDKGQGSGNYAVFVGRLSEEKDLETLLSAWEILGSNYQLKIIGDGPMADLARQASLSCNIEWLGQLPLEQTMKIVGEAKCLVIPSRWYEPFGRTVIESFSKGTPVVASNIGGISELVNNGVNGLFFEPTNSGDLADKIAEIYSTSHRQLATMRNNARNTYLDNYTEESNYPLLMDIYEQAMQTSQQTRAGNHIRH